MIVDLQSMIYAEVDLLCQIKSDNNLTVFYLLFLRVCDSSGRSTWNIKAIYPSCCDYLGLNGSYRTNRIAEIP